MLFRCFLHCRSSVVPLSKHTFEFCSSAGKCHESFYLNDLTRYVLTLRNCNLTLILVVIFSVFSGCQFRLHVGRCLPKSSETKQQVFRIQKGEKEEGNKLCSCKSPIPLFIFVSSRQKCVQKMSHMDVGLFSVPF